MKRNLLKIMSGVLVATMFAGLLTGCTGTTQSSMKKNKKDDKKPGAVEVFGDIEANEVEADFKLNNKTLESYTDFGLDLLKHNYEGENQLVSPLSVLTALTMAANGADGITLDEFEDLFGMEIEDMNAYLYTLKESISNERCDLNYANAIWVNKDNKIELDEDFLQAMADYFESNLYSESFDDECVEHINDFVDENTNGMIPKIIEDFEPDAEVVLVNALSFEAKWYEPFEEWDTGEGTFTNADESMALIEYLHGSAEYYISSDDCTGFAKELAGKNYEFVALLPNYDVDFEDFLEDLTGEDFVEMYEDKEFSSVSIAVPKFSYDYEVTLNDSLADMGIPSAFSPKNADFTAMTDDERELYISRVLHKTYIDVNESGVSAASATAVEEVDKCIGEADELVYLERSFVYAIVDTETGTPIFMGLVADLT